MKYSAIVLFFLVFISCEHEPVLNPQDPEFNFTLSMNTSFEGGDMERYTYYENVNGDFMSFEQLRMYLADISLVTEGGVEVALSDIEFMDFYGEPISLDYNVPEGDYSGLSYHIGVPTALNGTDNPDFLINQYGQESPLNVQNGMHWSWNAGYRFSIYEGRLDTTPDIDGDIPAFFSIHLGKDTLYTAMDVSMPFSVNNSSTTKFNIDWDLAKSFYNANDTLDLRSPVESQFHGDNLELGFRYQACMKDAIGHSVE